MRNIKFVWAQSGTSCTAKRTNIPLFHAPRPLSITLGTRTWLHKCLLSSHSFELEGGRYERKARQQRCFPTLRGMDSLLTSLVIYFLFECAHVLHATDFFFRGKLRKQMNHMFFCCSDNDDDDEMMMMMMMVMMMTRRTMRMKMNFLVHKGLGECLLPLFFYVIPVLFNSTLPCFLLCGTLA